MTEQAAQVISFAYEAQTAEGQPLTGTVDAPSVDVAQRQLQGMRLRVLQIAPVPAPAAGATGPRPKRLTGEDFLTFNQQLTHLTQAGLPIEHGLRLIAQDMRRGRLRATVQQLAADMESGTPLEQAFEKHRDKFPPLYARLVGAGVATSNLPAMLLGLGRHMELVHRLRASLWRVSAYPLMVLAGLGLVMFFISYSLIPQFGAIFSDFGIQLPLVTRVLLGSSGWVPVLLIAIACAIVAVPILWAVARAAGADRAVVDRLVLPMPLIGAVVRRNMVARWCDAVRLAVEAGLDLPRAIDLAGDAVGSPRLKRDGDEMIGALSSGRAPDAVVGSTRLLPATVPAAMTLASPGGGGSGGGGSDLAATLGTLSEMYQQQAETRLHLIPTLLTPTLILLVALLIGLVILGLFMPLITLIQSISGA